MMTDKKQTHAEQLATWFRQYPTPSADALRSSAVRLASRLDAAEAELARRDAAAAEAQRPAKERETRDYSALWHTVHKVTGSHMDKPYMVSTRALHGEGCVVVIVRWRIEEGSVTWERTYRIGATEAQIAADLRAALKAMEGMS